MSPYLLKDGYLSGFARSFHLAIFTFLLELGYEEKSCDQFATVFVHIIDYDNAYRLRLEDIFTETNKFALQNPRKEIKRLAGVMSDRDHSGIYSKFSKVANLLLFLLWIPKIKRAFIKAVNITDIEALKLDEVDRYWTAMRTDYKFWGMGYEERMSYAKDLGWTFPTPMK